MLGFGAIALSFHFRTFSNDSIVDAQTIGVLVTAASVTVAAIYYIFTLRINRNTQELALKALQQNLETRRIGLVDSIITRVFDEGFMKNIMELLRYEWTDYGDFERKYGSEKTTRNPQPRDLGCGSA